MTFYIPYFEYVLMGGVLLIAYIVRGVTGFGSALIAVPVLVQFEPLKFVVPLILVLDYVASLIIGGTSRKDVVWKEVGVLLPFGVIGAICGVYALVQYSSKWMLATLGLFTIFFGARNALGIKPSGAISRIWAIPAGIIGSSAGALFGTSAPPYMIYLTHRLADPKAARSTFSWLFIIDGGFRFVLFLWSGLLSRSQTWVAIVCALVPMACGLLIGQRIHVGVKRETILKWVGVVLIFSGLTLIVRALR